AGPELGDVEVEVARIAEQAVAVERFLMLEEQVVVLPEPALPSGALRGRRGQAGVGMELLLHLAVAAAVERKVSEHELHVRARAQEAAQVAEGVAARRPLEAGELDEAEGRLGRA